MARMKIPNFDSFRGLYFHISAPINVILGTGARAYCQISRFWGKWSRAGCRRKKGLPVLHCLESSRLRHSMSDGYVALKRAAVCSPRLSNMHFADTLAYFYRASAY